MGLSRLLLDLGCTTSSGPMQLYHRLIGVKDLCFDAPKRAQPGLKASHRRSVSPSGASPMIAIPNPQPTPFQIAIPEADIIELRQRLVSARWPDQLEDTGLGHR